MPPSTIYYIPPPLPSTSQQDQPILHLQHNIRQNLRSEPFPRWTLEYRHFRETPLAKPASAPTSAKTLHCLTLSWKPGKTWVGIVDETTTITTAPETSPTGARVGISSIPAAGLDEFWSLLALRLSPLWQPRGGGIISVREGMACRVGDFVIRVGELKLVVPAAAGTVPVSRGTVCQIVYDGQEIGDEAVGGVIKGVWEVVGEGIAGREVCRTKEGEEEVEGWIEALRGRDGR